MATPTTQALTDVRTRILGSSYTVWTALNSPILWCVDIEHESPRTVADPVPIQPLNYIRPAEILVPRAISYGRIVMNVIETYGHKPWEYLNGFFPSNAFTTPSENQGFSDLADVLNYMQDQLTDSNAKSQIELYRIIRTPASNGAAKPWYVTHFEGVRITDIRENEKANTNAMQNNLQITAMYTRKVDSQISAATVASLTGVNATVPNTSPIYDNAVGGGNGAVGGGYFGD